jgi:hypothetical protein
MNLPLPIHLSIHIFFSLCAGLFVWKIWKKPILASTFALLGGFFVDLDHFFDYYLAFGFKWNWFYFRNDFQVLKSGKIYILFHAWELVLILMCLVFLFKNKCAKTIFFSLALGLFFHLWTDVIIDQVSPKAYFLIYRIDNNFSNKAISSPKNYEKYLYYRSQAGFK